MLNKILVNIFALPIIALLSIIKPNDVIKHKYIVYGTLLGIINGYNFRAINFILNQLNLESANGKSNLSKTLNNVSGMRCVSKRINVQSGCFTTPNNGSFGMYASIYDCVQDRFLWGKYFKEAGKNQYQIEQLAANVYCSADKNYVEKINSLPNITWCIYLIILAIPLTIITPILIFKKIK